MSDQKYCYPPDYTVLINKPGFRDADELEKFERKLTGDRSLEKLPEGDFDLDHLRAIHKFLFRGIYDWAGEIRVVEISKGGQWFLNRRFITQGMRNVHGRILEHDYLRGLSPQDFSALAGEIIGDVNYIHPFREGNGRTQICFYEQLAENAGYEVDLSNIRRSDWTSASRQAHMGNYVPMGKCLYETLFPNPSESETTQETD